MTTHVFGIIILNISSSQKMWLSRLGNW